MKKREGRQSGIKGGADTMSERNGMFPLNIYFASLHGV